MFIELISQIFTTPEESHIFWLSPSEVLNNLPLTLSEVAKLPSLCDGLEKEWEIWNTFNFKMK